ncbi:hypothetical protein [Streptomyces sp. AM8-1-1]|uniref:hypothetical protein n=1 Tax=Streptomyces sp. AM8-1-1 TaxID=3075825 RepID=UPI0028C419FF|nr:hypothetical protein [Streptomyces sp. AM8-1-1]WNO70767.1 hypothetical protein RPQ07_03625 [Streptomyces sp. AM8-1-1]
MPMVRQEPPAKRRRVAVIEMTALCSNRELALRARVSGPVRAAAKAAGARLAPQGLVGDDGCSSPRALARDGE